MTANLSELALYPSPWHEDLLPQIRTANETQDKTIVVLDDDPTGSQTVYDTPILTRWKSEEIAEQFRQQVPLLYLLTNSRSLPVDEARELASEVALRLNEAAEETGRNFMVISRSDSTLRGHYPAEVDVIAESLGYAAAIHVLIPAFFEGQRLTVGDVHYVGQGEQFVPAAATPFAQDKAFGYENSNLKDWVEEKTGGRVAASRVRSLSLQTLREGGPVAAARELSELQSGDVCVVNAASYRDLEVAVAALIKFEQTGLPIVYRTAASFVRVRAGLSERTLLGASALGLTQRCGGLTVIGSYVEGSTRQWQTLQESGLADCVEFDVAALLDPTSRKDEITRVLQQIEAAMSSGRDAAVATSRRLVAGDDAQSSLEIGQQISDALAELVSRLDNRPRYIIAKGGITSSDLATEGLQIRQATVLGQIMPGVSVWQAGPESRFPDMPFIVFPGNVGTDESISELVRRLQLPN